MTPHPVNVRANASSLHYTRSLMLPRPMRFVEGVN
jgi:hypothetical protein